MWVPPGTEKEHQCYPQPLRPNMLRGLLSIHFYVARPFQLMFYSSFLLHHFDMVSCTCTVKCFLIPCCSHNSMNFKYVYYHCLTWVIFDLPPFWVFTLAFQTWQTLLTYIAWSTPKTFENSYQQKSRNTYILHVMLPLLDPEHMYEHSQESFVLSVAILKCILFCFSKNTTLVQIKF